MKKSPEAQTNLYASGPWNHRLPAADNRLLETDRICYPPPANRQSLFTSG
jgi:hypothetical protein